LGIRGRRKALAKRKKTVKGSEEREAHRSKRNWIANGSCERGIYQVPVNRGGR